MKKILTLSLGVVLAAALAFGQKGPKPKSQKEVDALLAVQNATDADGRMKAVDNLLTKFADTEFKAWALGIAADSAREKNDFEKMTLYAERAIEVDPKNYQSMLMLAQGIVTRTREFDLDKEEKLTRAEKYAKDAIEVLKTAEKPNPNITDEQWAGAKKDFTADGYEALGMAAVTRKKYDDAITNFKTAVDNAGSPDAQAKAKLRMAQAMNLAGKYDEALTTIDAVLASPNLNPAFRQFAGQEKLKAATGKAKK